MNDLEELKDFVVVHARSQKIGGYRRVLDRIAHDDGAAEGSWVRVWTEEGERYEKRGKLLEAVRHYAMARFPFVDGDARQDALDRCVSTFDRWRSEQSDLQRLDLELPEGRVRCWTNGLSAKDRRPLLLIMGGIVTVKEQWAPALVDIKRLGMAGIAVEMPGVGENTTRYAPESWRMLTSLLDAVADRADVDRTYAMALSFSGHLALSCAVRDPRIRGVVTTGAPIRGFFTDTGWHPRVPRITVDTLAHLTASKPDGVLAGMAPFALTAEQLRSVDIPLAYAASGRDEIIPGSEVRLLQQQVSTLRLLEFDDIHGSPEHTAETRLWCLRELLRASGGALPQRALFDLAWYAGRARRGLFGRPGPS